MDRPLALLSICSAVMPLAVPATLKSMSPRKSSRPWMSVRTATSSPSLMSPIAIPETGAADRHTGIHERERGATDRTHRRGAVGLEHLGDDPDRVRERPPRPGSPGASARSASAPWPMSRRFGPRMKPVSPTENGGKL